MGDAEFRAVVAEHAENWPVWVRDMRGPGAQAYAVLTLCRALHATRRAQASKRQAADFAIQVLPQWAPLIRWAQRWWYGGGTDCEDDRMPEVTRFVEDVSELVSRDHGTGPRDAAP